jgi:hypothetical protein
MQINLATPRNVVAQWGDFFCRSILILGKYLHFQLIFLSILMLLQHVSLLREYLWKCICMKIGMLLQKIFHPIAICMPLLRVAKFFVPLSRPGTSRDRLSKSRPVPARRKILSLSRCPFVPGQGRNFCPFVPKSCTVPSRCKRYFQLLSKPPSINQMSRSGGRLKNLRGG